MCTNNPEIQTSTGPRTIDNLGQTLNVLSVPSMQCLINAINIQRQARIAPILQDEKTCAKVKAF